MPRVARSLNARAKLARSLRKAGDVPLEQAEVLTFTSSHLLSHAVKQKTGNDKSRYVFKVDEWATGMSAVPPKAEVKSGLLASAMTGRGGLMMPLGA